MAVLLNIVSNYELRFKNKIKHNIYFVQLEDKLLDAVQHFIHINQSVIQVSVDINVDHLSVEMTSSKLSCPLFKGAISIV